jgi:MFS transporter, SET family, sugar efflux transporter
MRFLLPPAGCRGVAFSMLMQGLGMGCGMPYVGIFLVTRLHAPAPAAGAFFATALIGPAVTIAIGRLSDRVAARRAIVCIASGMVAAGWVLVGLANSAILVLIAGAVFFCFIGTVNAQQSAILREIIATPGATTQNLTVSRVRAWYSAGWAIGPLVGASMAFGSNIRCVFLISAVAYGLSIAPNLLRTGVNRIGKSAASTVNKGNFRLVALLSISATVMLVGDSLRSAYLPIRLADVGYAHGLAPSVIVASAPILQILLIPVLGHLADVVGGLRVLAISASAGCAGYTILAFADQFAFFIVSQVLIAAMMAAVLGLGPVIAQDLLPARVGTASASFFSSISLAGGLGGMAGAISAQLVGIPTLFLIASVLSCIGILILDVVRRARPAILKTDERNVSGTF